MYFIFYNLLKFFFCYYLIYYCHISMDNIITVNNLTTHYFNDDVKEQKIKEEEEEEKLQRDSHIPVHRSKYGLPSVKTTLSSEEKAKLCKNVFQEIVEEKELVELFNKVPNPVVYDGFEPSGKMHIAQGLMKRNIVNMMTQDVGATFIFWIADWFAKLNLKQGGDLQKIQILGRYFIQVWKACGMNLNRVKFLWCSNEIKSNQDQYWELVFDIATRNSVNRITKCTQIMGRSEKDALQTSQLFYPVMQTADVFFLNVDICQLGLDQRKVNMLAREYASETKRISPIVCSHHMLPGLLKNQEKMSKSNPDSAIFMEDSAEEVARKIKIAYCPPNQVDGNPCLSYFKHIVFPSLENENVTIVDPKENTSMEFKNFEELTIAYTAGKIHPLAIKSSLTNYINTFLEPVRQYFINNTDAKELLEQVNKLSNFSTV